jgi:hypothetical protein
MVLPNNVLSLRTKVEQLQTNLRNAASTFGVGSPQYHEVEKMVMEYREKLQQSFSGAQEWSEKSIPSVSPEDPTSKQDAATFGGLSLVYRPKRS